MDQAGNQALRDAIKHIHGCDSKWVESVPVRETFNDDTVWDGEVQVFYLLGHPTATRAYAWSHETEEGRRRCVAVLNGGPIKDAATAVRASLAHEASS
jgi:hypothetical protein